MRRVLAGGRWVSTRLQLAIAIAARVRSAARARAGARIRERAWAEVRAQSWSHRLAGVDEDNALPDGDHVEYLGEPRLLVPHPLAPVIHLLHLVSEGQGSTREARGATREQLRQHVRHLVVEDVVSLHFDLRPVVPRDGGELLGELDHLVSVCVRVRWARGMGMCRVVFVVLCVCACVRACVRACVPACLRACVRARAAAAAAAARRALNGQLCVS